MAGTLYVVATPLGNLEDVTQRALRVLRDVDLIAAEDTRHSRKLLSHYDIHTRLTSYHDQNEARKSEVLLCELGEGRSVALISDAGTPGIADPGYDLVRAAVAAGIEVVPVPGPCAATAALSISGLPTDRFSFEGFLPSKPTRRRGHLLEIAADARTLVLYEAPHRIQATLQDLADVLGPERQAVILREATKMYESVVRGTLDELRSRAQEFERGEVTLVVAGAPPAAAAAAFDLDREIEELRRAGRHSREIADELAAKHDLPRREVYRRVVKGGA